MSLTKVVECPKCGHKTEVLRSVKRKHCTKCGIMMKEKVKEEEKS